MTTLCISPDRIIQLLLMARPPGFSCWCGGPQHTKECIEVGRVMASLKDLAKL